LAIFLVALPDFGEGRFHLRLKRGGPLAHFCDKALNALDQRSRRAVSFFQGGGTRGSLRSDFRGRIAPSSQSGQSFLSVGGL